MKVNFTFDTEQEDDSFKLKCMLQAESMYFALDEIKDSLRSILKYNQGLKESAIDQAEYISDEFFNILEELSVNLDLAE